MSNNCLFALVLGTLSASASALDIHGRVTAAGKPRAQLRGTDRAGGLSAGDRNRRRG